MPNHSRAALTTLFILQATMLASLYAGVPPHPPVATPFFGMGPFLGLCLSLAASALLVVEGLTGRLLRLSAALLPLISYGPHKYVDANISLIWPAVVAAQIACAVILAEAPLRRMMAVRQA